MNSATYYTFTVKGSGKFPADMLRFDAAWPVTTSSAFRILNDDKHLREIHLRSARKPTVDRWKSFGWTVSDIHLDR